MSKKSPSSTLIKSKDHPINIEDLEIEINKYSAKLIEEYTLKSRHSTVFLLYHDVFHKDSAARSQSKCRLNFEIRAM